MKKTVCLLLCLALCLSAAACGSRTRVGAYGIRTIQTLVEQDYSLAFRTNDPTADLVIAALEVLSAEGKVDELSTKWFGGRLIDFDRNAKALDEVKRISGETDLTGLLTHS